MKDLCVALAVIGLLSAACPPQYVFEYTDDVHGFRICLPAGLSKQAATGYPAGSVLFTGFALAPNTNLRSRQLVIIPGDYDLLKNTTHFSHFSANTVTFEYGTVEEGSAGHLTLHLVYTWRRGTSAVHFDFQDRSVNIYNFDPANRPAEYDRAAEVKITQQIMSTFQKL